jgi:transcriptional regulator with XRE-family HTH domain
MPAVRSTHSAPYQRFLGRLRQARREACLTQAEVGRKIGARQAFVSKVESGERRLDPVELAQFAAVYGKPLGWFLGSHDGPEAGS